MNKKIITFLITLIIILPFVFDYAFYQYYRSDNINSKLSDKFISNPPKILAIGSSRASAALRSDGFNRSFMSITSSLMDIHLIDIVARHFLPQLKKSQHVIIEVMAESLFIDSMNNAPHFFSGLSDFGIPFYDRPSLIWSKKYINFSLIVPHLIRHRMMPRELYGKWLHRHIKAKTSIELKEPISNGFKPNFRVSTNEQLAKSAERKILALKEKYREDALKKGILKLKKLIAFFKKENINFCLMNFPLTSSLKLLTHQLFRRAQEISDQYYELYGCLPRPLDMGQFKPPLAMYDSDHLHYLSALRFSKYLSNHLEKRN